MNFTEDETTFVDKQLKNNSSNALCSSDFPQIDSFVKKYITNGHISSIRFYENVGTRKPMIVYEIMNMRFCGNIGRSHKSNNIYYVADISRKCIYQKCWASSNDLGSTLNDWSFLDFFPSCLSRYKNF